MAPHPRPAAQSGFSLIEMMVSMTIGLVIIAGVIGIFISQSKLQSGEANRSELLSDLQLASAIIQTELRQAQDVYTCGTEVLYRPLDSTSPIASTCPITINSANGAFQLVAGNSSGSASSCDPNGSTARLCWDRPEKGDGCQELMRNIKANGGLSVSVDSYGVYTVRITGQFCDQSRALKDLSMDIHVWPRN
ncbi:MAG: prepilin-type N-terminal cleavage/methylation domain-containing protein [Mariprofundales bacterium]|nr:prepilin-type N-terminal cleavage/methylation domain-containing protein [Mariprofundales bacterium]